MAPLLEEDEEVVVSAVEEKEEELDIGLGVAAEPAVRDDEDVEEEEEP